MLNLKDVHMCRAKYKYSCNIFFKAGFKKALRNIKLINLGALLPFCVSNELFTACSHRGLTQIWIFPEELVKVFISFSLYILEARRLFCRETDSVRKGG